MKLVLKGFLIGLGKIMPGVSGAMIAITLNEYNKIIESIATLKKDIYNNLKYLSTIGIGIMLAIISMSKIIVNCLEQYYFATMLLFISVISSGIVKTIKVIKMNKSDLVKSISLLLIGAIILKTLKQYNFDLNTNSTLNFIKLILIGIVDAGSSIIPGISGTALLMYFGYYDKIINTFATITKICLIRENIKIIIPFTIGFVVGTVIISKIINKIIKKHSNIINIMVCVFMIYTLITLTKNTIQKSTNIKETLLGIIISTISLLVSLKISNKKQKN